MRRREFLGGLCSVIAWPLTAVAQQTSRTPRVAVLIAGEETDRDVQATAVRSHTRARKTWMEGWA